MINMKRTNRIERTIPLLALLAAQSLEARAEEQKEEKVYCTERGPLGDRASVMRCTLLNDTNRETIGNKNGELCYQLRDISHKYQEIDHAYRRLDIEYRTSPRLSESEKEKNNAFYKAIDNTCEKMRRADAVANKGIHVDNVKHDRGGYENDPSLAPNNKEVTILALPIKRGINGRIVIFGQSFWASQISMGDRITDDSRNTWVVKEIKNGTLKIEREGKEKCFLEGTIMSGSEEIAFPTSTTGWSFLEEKIEKPGLILWEKGSCIDKTNRKKVNDAAQRSYDEATNGYISD